MRLKTTCLTFCLALAAAAPVQAADWNNGSIKDRGGVEVPAPIPVVEAFKWYLRADVGGGLLKGGTTTASGDIYGMDRDPLDGPAFGLRSAWFDNGFDTFAVGGVGAGAYITPRLRADVTVDARTKSTVDVNGRYRYYTDPDLTAGESLRVDGEARERIEVRATTGLLNLYYDFAKPGSSFIPYIGAGAGFVVRSIDRRHTSIEHGTNPMDPDGAAPVFTRTLQGQSKAHQLAPAAAAMAGVGITLDNGMVLDLNYRFTYLGEVDNSTNINYSNAINGVRTGATRVTIGDTYEHAIRAGVRWNVW